MQCRAGSNCDCDTYMDSCIYFIFFLLVIREIYFTVLLQCEKNTPSLVLCCTFVRKNLPPVYCF